MEMTGTSHNRSLWVRCVLAAMMMLLVVQHRAYAQSYTIRDGRMYIEINKKIREGQLDSFIARFDLSDLPLKEFLLSNHADSLLKLGWKIDINNEVGLVISKLLMPVEDVFNPADKVFFIPKGPFATDPVKKTVFGFNRFHNKYSFATEDSIVRFFLRGQGSAKRVFLAGSFNNWSPEALRMDRTDSGWIAAVKLAPGKHWYKFVVDGGWQVDGDNLLKENDGRGNINSVYYRTNHVFELEGHTNAKKVFLAGSFNQWNAKSLPMLPTGNGWQIPVYLAEGTHTYKFVVDNRWIADPRNNERMDDGAGGFNSVIRLGQPHHFRLDGFANAKKVMLSGTFNNWNPSELPMNKTATGWELPYVVGAGNHEYKFIVDGQWIADPANPATEGKNGNSFLVAQPNYVFRLKGFDNAKSVFLSGTFNDWKPAQLAMKREGDSWVFPIYLEPGKHLYKFVVDGKWILDPQNRLWEQNKEGSGNSVMWIEPGR